MILPFKVDPRRTIELRLLRLAGIFLFLYAAALTLAPAARLHSWRAPYLWQHWFGWAAWLCGFWLMFRYLGRSLPNHDPYMLPSVALLSGWGLLTIWRLDTNLGMRQTIWLTLGILVLYFAVRSSDLLRVLRRYKYFWLLAGLLLTILTFFFGSYPGGEGPHLWLGCCGVYFQPSEPLKLLLIAYLAAYLADQLPLHWGLPQLIAPTLIVAAAATALLIAQRDLGTASLLIVLYTLIIFIASGRRRILAIAAAVILAAGAAGYLFFDVIRLRVDAWLNPWLDPYGQSYQIVQALIAIASGRVFGTGPGLGSPNLVPIATSDFIGTAVAEETGLMGLSALILVYSLLFLRGLVIAINSRASYQRFLATGLSAYFATQAIFILGGNLRLLPLTGVTLPFVSYGGSSLITAFISAALLLLISGEQLETQTTPVKPAPILATAGIGLAGFLALTLLAGWWGVIRSESLQFRPDNLRWTIHERYVPRGSLLDRDNRPIAVSQGAPGEFTRVLLYPDLANTIGYNHPRFGKSGLEASLDAYLTGLKGNPSSLIWLNEWIYSQPPPGLDVRLSLDLSVQTAADDLLGGSKGALVLINAESGEILAMASHPTYDPNQLDENWDTWSTDPNAPLLNRATQGNYPAGAALGPFFFAAANSIGSLPSTPRELILNQAGSLQNCALLPESGEQWGAVIRAGCPGPVNDLISIMSSEQIHNLFLALGFYESPPIELPVNQAESAPILTDLTASMILSDGLRLSPLQMSVAAATITHQGRKPVPHLATAVLTPHQGWVVLPSQLPIKTLNLTRLNETINALAGAGSLYWSSIALDKTGEDVLTWYIGGSVPRWQGAPLAIALVLEEDNPQLAQAIGQGVLQAAMSP